MNRTYKITLGTVDSTTIEFLIVRGENESLMGMVTRAFKAMEKDSKQVSGNVNRIEVQPSILNIIR